MKKWLEKLLGKELFDQFMAKIGDNEKHLLYQEKEGDFVPRSRLKEETDKLEPLQTKVTKLESDLTTATEKVTTLEGEKKAGTQTTDDKLEALQKTIDNMKTEGEKKDKKLALQEKVGILKSHLGAKGIEANPKYVVDIIRRFEKDGSLDHLEVENGKIKGFDDLHKPIFENNPEMYGEFKVAGSEPGGGERSDGLGETESMKKYKTLMAKKPEVLTSTEKTELGDLAVKVKNEQKEKKE